MEHVTPFFLQKTWNRRLKTVACLGLLFALCLVSGRLYAQGPISGGGGIVANQPATHTLHISISNHDAICGITMSGLLNCTSVPNGTPVFCDPALNAIMDQYGAIDFYQVSPDSRFLFLREIYEVKCTSVQLGADLKAYDPGLFPYYTETITPEPFLYYPNDTLTPQCNPGDWRYLDYIGAPKAWEIEKGNANKFIGITEVTVDTSFLDLNGKVQIMTNSPGAQDYAHGTAVTNIAVAKTDNNHGMPSIGFNCRAKFRAGYSTLSVRDLAKNDGVRVINGSWGSPLGFNTPVYQEATNLGFVMPLHEAYEYGAVSVFAAGNSHDGNAGGSSVVYPYGHSFPASSDYGISVSSIGWEKPYNTNYPAGTTNIKDVYQWFKGDSMQNCAFRNNKVDILAPGQDIWTFGYDTLTGKTIYKKGTGTSASAPVVAGTVALMQAHNSCLTPYQIEYILKKTANATVLQRAENLPFAGRLGAGKLEAGDALEAVHNGTQLLPNQTEFNCNSPQTASFEISGMEFNTLCAPGVVNGLRPKFTLTLKGGTPPYRFRWMLTDTAQYKLSAYNVQNPELTYTSILNARRFFYVTAYDASPIEKVASIQFYVNLIGNADSAQLAMRDSEHDMLDEPNTMFITDKYRWDIWQSPDLWNRQRNDGIKIHQDPEYFNTDSNYVYARVRNIGCKTSQPAYLTLNWTLASTGERWPQAWNGHDSVDKEPTGKIAGGGTISPNVPVPAILAGKDVTVSKGWRPIKPELIKWNPLSGTLQPQFDPHSVHACILARLVELSRSYPRYGIDGGEGAMVHENVKANNNIVTRNLTVMNLNQSNRPLRARRVIINNPMDEASVVTLQFVNDKTLRPFVAGNYGSAGNVEIALGDLYDRWALGGMQGSGIQYVNEENHSIIIDGSEPLRLDNIFLNGNESFDVGVTFKMLHNDFYEGQEFLFSLQQFLNPEGEALQTLDMDAVQGNVDFLVKLSFMPELEPQERRATMPEGLVSKSAGILLYPNPTEKTLLLQKTEVYKDKVQLQIVDMTGRVVLVREFESMDTQPVQIEVGNLVPGMYQAVLKEAGGKTWREPFVKR